MEISFEQLPAAVSQVFAKLENIERLLSEGLNNKPTESDELLTVQAAAAFLSLSVPTIYGLISKRELPVMKRSKRCYFSKAELMNYLRKGRNRTIAETALDVQRLPNMKTK